ncbi:MAG: helix-turn-helix domain-containing protein [Flavobacteriales bacterium]|nr:helix-turn-helix domain-containing protein [Flavobacteriales bacterium]
MKTIVISVEEFQQILDQRLDLALSKLGKEEEHGEETLVTRKDIARLFGVSLVTVNAWMKKGLLPFHRINRRIYFKKSEVLATLENVKKYRRP